MLILNLITLPCILTEKILYYFAKLDSALVVTLDVRLMIIACEIFIHSTDSHIVDG